MKNPGSILGSEFAFEKAFFFWEEKYGEGTGRK